MFKDKIVVVTGASGGLGKGIARAYGDAGAQVIATDIAMTDFKHDKIQFMTMDLKSKESIEKVFQDIVEKYGTIHVLINNGAISQFHKSIFELSVEEFDEVLAVNLRGSFITSKEFIKANRGQNYGRIINIASTRFNQNEAGWDAYGASKGGVVALTSSMAVSLSETPITVNAISPGWIHPGDLEELTEKDHLQHPSGRVGKVEDIVKACFYLSAEDNTFVNGTNLIVDGGMTKKMIYE